MSIYQQHNPGDSSALYLKLGDGDRVKGRIASQPAISVYREGDRPRYSWIIFVREFNGKEVNRPQILTKGISVYKGIADLVEDWGEPTEFDVSIKRTGAGLNDTEYSVNPVKESKDLTKAELEEVEKVDLIKAVKGKWLSDFVDDGELPDPVSDLPRLESDPPPTDADSPTGYAKAKAMSAKLKGEADDMPPDFLLDEDNGGV